MVLYEAPLSFFEVDWNDVMWQAFNRRAVKPRQRLYTLDKRNDWQQFWAFQCRHWWVGDHNLVRFHAFFRTVRESPSSSNIVREGDTKINYIDAKSESQPHHSDPANWKKFNKKEKKWEAVYPNQVTRV